MRAHYFSAHIQNYFQNGDAGGSCQCPGQATLESALREGVEIGTYYVLECGYEAYLTIRKVCRRCEDSGTIRQGKRVVREKPCPDCKGAGSEIVISAFQVMVHQNAVDRHLTPT